MEVVCSFNVPRAKLEDSYRIILSSAFMVVAVPIVILNFLVILAIWKTSSLHKPSKILLANLALTDFLIGSVICPNIALESVIIMMKWDTFYCNIWPIGTSSVFCIIGMNLYILTVMSVDRFLAIKMKLTYRNIVTNKRVIATMAFGWTIGFVGSIVVSVFLYHGISIIALAIIVVIVCSILLCTLAIFTFLSFYYLKKYTSQTHNSNQQLPNTSSPFDVRSYRRTFYTMMMVLLAIFSSFLPYFFVMLVREITNTTPLILILMPLAGWFTMANSAINPVLYLWRMKDLRQAVKAILRRPTQVEP